MGSVKNTKILAKNWKCTYLILSACVGTGGGSNPGWRSYTKHYTNMNDSSYTLFHIDWVSVKHHGISEHWRAGLIQKNAWELIIIRYAHAVFTKLTLGKMDEPGSPVIGRATKQHHRLAQHPKSSRGSVQMRGTLLLTLPHWLPKYMTPHTRE